MVDISTFLLSALSLNDELDDLGWLISYWKPKLGVTTGVIGLCFSVTENNSRMYENNKSCFAAVLFTSFNKKCLWMFTQWFAWRIFIRGFNPRSFRDKTFVFVNDILIEVTFSIDFLFLTNIMYNLNWFIFNKIADLKKTVWNYLSSTIKSLISTSKTGFLNRCFFLCLNFFLFLVLNFLSFPYLSYTSWQFTALPRWWMTVLLPPNNLLQKFTLIWVNGDKFDILLKLKQNK